MSVKTRYVAPDYHEVDIERQRIVRLLVKETLVTDDKVTICYSIPLSGLPGGGLDPSEPGHGGREDENYLLRLGRRDPRPEAYPAACPASDASFPFAAPARLPGQSEDLSDPVDGAGTRMGSQTPRSSPSGIAMLRRGRYCFRWT